MVISLTPKTFLQLLTPPEVVAIATSTNMDVIYFRTLFYCSERVRADDPSLLSGLALLQDLDLLSTETMNKINTRLLLGGVIL